MEQWIVTAASTNYFLAAEALGKNPLLISFIASLRETAGWTGNIGIMNYGLTPHECWTLRNNGIEVIAPSMKYAALIDDRFNTIGQHFKKRNAQIAEWDLDMWFCKPVHDIFDILKPQCLAATYDATHQGFMQDCVAPEMRAAVGKFIEQVRLEIPNVLQGGFIAGDSSAWYNYSAYQDTLIDLGVCKDVFGVDMVALNLYKHFHPERVQVMGVEWNCLPEWQIYKEGDNFMCHESKEPLKAIHVSSPNRKGPFMYHTHYPEQFEKWKNLLR